MFPAFDQRLVSAIFHESADIFLDVLVGFRLGDLYAETFQYTNGDKAGEIGVSLKARLLKIVWIRPST